MTQQNTRAASQFVGPVRRVDLQLEGSYDCNVQGARRGTFPPHSETRKFTSTGSNSISQWFLKLVSLAAHWRLNKSANPA